MTSNELLALEFYHRNFDRLLAALFGGGFLLFIGSSFIGTGADLIVGDGAYYFEYARSLMAHGHLPTTHIKYPCGVPMIGLIGYAPAVWISRALIAGGALTPDARWITGVATPLQIAYCLPLLAFAFIAFRANASMLERLGFAPRVVKPMVLFWIVATNIGFYVFKEPGLSESSTYASLSLFYWGLTRWFYLTPAERSAERPEVPLRARLREALFLGIMLGLSGTVRQQNILHSVALPLLLMAQARLLFAPRHRVRRSIQVVAVAAAASAMLFMVPWLAWYAADRRFVFFSYGEEHFNFLSPHPLDALFHPGYHGLFVWHPAFMMAAIGLFIFLRARRDLAPTWLVPMAIQVYLVSAWYWLGWGATVGHRGFFTVFPLLLAGWVQFGQAAANRGRERRLVVAIMVLIVANAVVTALLLTKRLDPLGLPPL